MAYFEVDGFDELIEDMAASGEASGQLADEMCLEAARITKEHWEKEILSHGYVDTGAMISSVGYPRRPKTIGDIKTIDIYPQGRDHKGVRNAEKAYILHYGRNGNLPRRRSRRRASTRRIGIIIGSYFVDRVKDASAEPVVDRLIEMWDKHLNKHKL